MKMQRPPEIKGRILADLHVHISKRYLREDKLNYLLQELSWGVTGVTACNERESFIRYEDILNLRYWPGVKIEEIDSGVFASVEYNGNTGYIMKNQEVLSDHHLLGVGIKKYIKNYDSIDDSIKAMEENQDTTRILAHPGFKSIFLGMVRYINRYEKAKVEELCENKRIHEIESFTAFAVSWLKYGNKIAKEFTEKYGFGDFSVTDGHSLLEQLKKAGIYIKIGKNGLNANTIHNAIRNHDFIPFKQYLTMSSFIKCLVLKNLRLL